ncbi:MAG: rhomboid family intramembrane serine protease, partial [Candidatus Methanomethyliales bacterium]|nr:rhomboid family intramembrane serine protease [Candidatus Methanomethylicales archaeon]
MPIPEGGPARLGTYRMTILLIAINLLVYGLSSFENSFLGIGDYWLSIGGFVPLLMPNPSQWYRVFTSMFLHSDLFHILFNMYFLFIFGRSVERTLGKYRFLALYLTSGIMASLFHTAFGFIEGPISYSIPAIGASGAISGILGAYLMLYPGTSLLMILPVFFFPWIFWIKASYYILFWFATQVIYGFAKAAGGTAVFAHAGGLVAGVFLIYLLAERERIAQLRVLRHIAFTSYLRFGPRRTRGLGKFTKTLFSILLLLLLAFAAYASLSPTNLGKVKSLTAQYTCQGLPYSDHVGIRLPDIESQLSSIPLDKTRILLNRLSAAGLLYNTTSRELSLVGYTADLPLRLKLDSTVATVKVSTTISFKGFYDADGFLS